METVQKRFCIEKCIRTLHDGSHGKPKSNQPQQKENVLAHITGSPMEGLTGGAACFRAQCLEGSLLGVVFWNCQLPPQ